MAEMVANHNCIS